MSCRYTTFTLSALRREARHHSRHFRSHTVRVLLTICGVVLAIALGSSSASAHGITYPAGVIPESVAVADLNADGSIDVVVTNYYAVGSVSVLLGNGDGTLDPVVTYYLPGNAGNPSYVVLEDLNKDSTPDLAVAGELCSSTGCRAGVIVLLGNGDGTFQWSASYAYSSGSPAASVAVADFDKDGNRDLAVAVNVCAGTCTGGVALLIGDGLGGFHWGGSYSAGGPRASLAVGDFNKDGKVDLAAASGADVRILSGNSDGTFQLTATYPTGAYRPAVWGDYSYLVAVGDTNGDGNLDLTISNGCAKSINQCNGIVASLNGNGDGSFQAAEVFPSGGWLSMAVALGDFDSNGILDVAVANQCANKQCHNGTVGVLLRNGPGSGEGPTRYSSGGWVATSVAVGDFNRDGQSDLAVANFCANENDCSRGTVGVLLGNGDGTFTRK
jgi:hypothetical protein